MMDRDLERFVEQSVPTCFEAQVRQTPRNLAIKFEDQTLSYDQLNRAANRLARSIVQRRGAELEPVALLIGRGSAVIVAILAALKAGKLYVALDPADPPARLRTLLTDSEAKLLVTNDANLPLAAELCPDVLNLDRPDESLSDADLGLPVPADALLNIMFTSGSTGRSKGVVQTHRNLLQAIWARADRLHATADDRVAFLLSCSFGVSATELFGTLLTGAAVLPFDVRQQGFARLADWIDAERITIFHSVPTVFRGLVDALAPGRVLESVRVVKMGGESVFRRDAARFCEHFPATCVFHTALGTTETYIAATYELDRAAASSFPVLPAGFPEVGKEILLVDDELKPVLPGEVGEVLVKSRYLSPGYWRRPDLTDAAYLPDPAGGPDRLYRTGDMGRLLPDGCLLHLGRKDFQVKIRGHLVATAEIEMALRELPGVRDAAVVAREDQAGDKRLYAYVVPAGDPPPTSSALRNALAETFPPYKLPSAFAMAEQLPRLVTGKVDVQALPALDGTDRSSLGTSYAAPVAPLEQQLVEIWERLLDVRPVGVHDDFFDLGGDSLRAAHLFAEVETRLGRRTRLSSLLRAPTIAQLAQVLTEDDQSVLVPIQTGGAKRPFFCIHDLSGEVFGYAALARYLGPDQPVYGLEAVGPDSEMEVIAARYLEAIRSIQPSGPYRLGGYCFGGFVAYEMARQLEAQGERVDVLAIMEGFAPVGRSTTNGHTRRRQRVLAPALRNLPVWCDIYGRALVHSGPSEIKRRARLRLLRAQRRLAPDEIVSNFDDFSASSREIMSMNIAAVRGYTTRPYSGRVTLFRSRALPLARAHDPSMGWGVAAAGGVEIHEFHVTHEALLQEPNVRLVARELADCLDRAG